MRIITLVSIPLHTFSDYQEKATMGAARNVSGGTEARQSILDFFTSPITLQRQIGEAGD